MSVIDEVAAERRRQIEELGWSPAKDDEWVEAELARAAGSYAIVADLEIVNKLVVPPTWPWPTEWYKPADRRDMLVKAAALVVAEIERLDRAPKRVLQ